ncbi:cupin domain-containing protein [Azospirillum sp. B506]|uniref:cupin domain-containing protein n=1 Tax=Azospirillum sp. B506 TaxID=137721 RepID=UPI000678DCE5|nr:cupin domain-containing protein [Azospirillum sp. B506]
MSRSLAHPHRRPAAILHAGLLAGLLTGSCLLSSALPLPALAQTASPQPAAASAPRSIPLLQTETNSNGTPVVYPKGAPQITARITEIPPGVRTGVHTHQIPLFVYILAGKLTIRGENGESTVYKEGDAYMERTDWHEGINEGSEPVRLLAVYPGEVGTPLSVKRAN